MCACGTGAKCHGCMSWFVPGDPDLRRVDYKGCDWHARCVKRDEQGWWWCGECETLVPPKHECETCPACEMVPVAKGEACNECDVKNTKDWKKSCQWCEKCKAYRPFPKKCPACRCWSVFEKDGFWYCNRVQHCAGRGYVIECRICKHCIGGVEGEKKRQVAQ